MWPLAGPAPHLQDVPLQRGSCTICLRPTSPLAKPGEDLEGTALPASQDHRVLKHQTGAHEATASLSLYVYETEEAIS